MGFLKHGKEFLQRQAIKHFIYLFIFAYCHPSVKIHIMHYLKYFRNLSVRNVTEYWYIYFVLNWYILHKNKWIGSGLYLGSLAESFSGTLLSLGIGILQDKTKMLHMQASGQMSNWHDKFRTCEAFTALQQHSFIAISHVVIVMVVEIRLVRYLGYGLN